MSSKIKFKQIAFPSNNKVFIKGDGTFDSNSYAILDENNKISLNNIPDSVILKACYYEEFINADYTPKLGETIIVIDYIKVNDRNVPSFVIGDGSTMLKNLKISSEYVENANHSNTSDDLGGREETREEQFTYQATANDESIKDGLAIVKSIKGNTVVANQLVKNCDFSNGTVAWQLINISIQDNNDYLTLGRITTGIQSIISQPITVIQDHIYLLTFTFRGTVVIYFAALIEKKFVANDFTKTNYIITATNYNYLRFYVINKTFDLKKDVRVFDLTQMFGAGNEPATVEEFERLYQNLPKEYNEGSLLNLNAEAIKSVGFNAFNGEYAQLLEGMQYYLGGNITSLAFKENLEDEGEVIEILSDNLYTPNTNGYLVATGNDICINLSHSGYRNGEYEPYKESIVNLPIKKYFPDGMKSAGEVKDKIIWDESIKKYKAIQRIDTRAYQTGDEDLANVITDKVNTYYELETPIETIINDYDLIYYKVSDFGTEEIIADESTTPIIADIQYGFNAVDEIRNHRFEINKLKKSINDGTLTITQGEEILGEFSANQESNTTIELSKVASSGDYNDLSNKPNIQAPIGDLNTIRSNATNGNTAYGWGNHANVGYAKQSEVTEEINHAYNTLFDKIPTELPPIDNSVTNTKIADNAVSTSKIQNKAIIGSKIGQEEITTNHIANSSITNAKLAKSSITINGTPIALGGIGQILGLVTANGNRCFLEIANNELILSAPSFAENGSIRNIEEIVRYPLLTELPTIPNPTTNATEITDVNNWFNSNINSYIIPENLMYEFLSGKNSMSQMLLQLNGASCTLTSYNLDFKMAEVDMTILISNLTRYGYEVYVENDIDSITTSGICTLKFKIDNHQVIIECYRKFN